MSRADSRRPRPGRNADSGPWDAIYEQRRPTERSWYQAQPRVSLQLLDHLDVGPSASVVDVGGGDSPLVDALVARGHQDIAIVDISSAALEMGRRRLSPTAPAGVVWVEADVRAWRPSRGYDVWHDRAVFISSSRPTTGTGTGRSYAGP